MDCTRVRGVNLPKAWVSQHSEGRTGTVQILATGSLDLLHTVFSGYTDGTDRTKDSLLLKGIRSHDFVGVFLMLEDEVVKQISEVRFF